MNSFCVHTVGVFTKQPTSERPRNDQPNSQETCLLRLHPAFGSDSLGENTKRGQTARKLVCSGYIRRSEVIRLVKTPSEAKKNKTRCAIAQRVLPEKMLADVVLQQSFDDILLCNPFRFCLVIAHDAVAQHEVGDGLYVFDVGRILAAHGRMSLGAQGQVLAGARAGAPGKVIGRFLRGAGGAGTGFGHQAHGVFEYVVRHRNLADHLLEIEDLFCIEHVAKFHLPHRSRVFDHLDFLFVGRVRERNVEHKTVELGFRQRISAFLLDGVLGGQYKKRRRQGVAGAADGHMYMFRDMLRENVHLAFGSDWTVAPLNPLEGIYAAVTRRTLDDLHPGGWVPEQKISVEDALRAYTAGCAYAGFSEQKSGQLKPGNWADFVVLSENILEIEPKRIRDVKVIQTVIGGKTVFKMTP